MADLRETSMPARLSPPRVRLPKLIQGVGFAFFRRKAMRSWIKRHGRIFEINVPFFGRSIVVSDPALVRSVCTASAEQLSNVQPNLGNWFGPGSVFGLDDGTHRDRRRLLAPAFHGQSLKIYEDVIVGETLRECANWPEDQEFRMLEPMNRITLNVILRTIFGADGPELEELRAIVPPYMKLGQLMAFVPAPPSWTGRPGPWGRLDELRTAFDRIVCTLDRSAPKPIRVSASGRTSWHSWCAEGTATKPGCPRMDLCDELLTLICAGHETTASALGWTFERLRRHPDVLAELVSRGRRGGQCVPPGHNCRVAAGAHRHRCGRPPGQGAELRPRRRGDSARPHGAHAGLLISTRIRKSSRTPNDSIRIASAAHRRWHRHGWRSVAERDGASAPTSRSPKWMSCCERYCRTSGSRPMPPRMRSRISGESPTRRNSAAG